MEAGKLNISVQGVSMELAYYYRAGTSPPLVCLHGFGSTKEDYVDLTLHPEFEGRGLFLWDTPGCGESEICEPDALSIPFLVEVAIAMCDSLEVDRFHLAGHSMGGLTALMLAQEHPDRVVSFIDIEGNLAPEDCFLSRQIIEHADESPEAFFTGFMDRVKRRPEFSSALYSIALPIKVRPTTCRPVFESMVELSDTLPLLDIMGALNCPKMFVYGEQNRHLSYLGQLPERGVELIEIPCSGHFPMYSNPPVLWEVMTKFLAKHDANNEAD